jgi:hypothetical protein
VRHDFCAFILTHGRPDRVYTYTSLMNTGYTGKVYIVCDDEDKTLDQYRAIYGDKVLVFSKKEIVETFDEGDNFNDRRAIIYARNACFDLAEQVGCKYFIQLDDDYTGWYYRFNSSNNYGVWRIDTTMDDMLSSIIEYLDATPTLTIAISQGGDHIGGGEGKQIRLLRKAMNTFVCSTERKFSFFGRINEDVNTYTTEGRRGKLFFTVLQAQVNQKATQSNSGGMTDLYLDSGTYVKTFYSVMYCPSSVKIATLGDNRSPHLRIHHAINWNHTAPKILSEKYRISQKPPELAP